MENIRYMSLDIETYSSEDLKTRGVYRYSEAPDFEILLLGYSVNGNPAQTIDIASGEKVPKEIIEAIIDDNVIKWAFNASFERICLSSWLKKNYPQLFKGYGKKDDYIAYLNPVSWKCSMVWSAYLGLPLSLDGVGKILKLEDQKMKEGLSLIHYFSIPCRPTKINGGRNRNFPYHDLTKWNTFKAYNTRDVQVEMAIQQRLAKHLVPDSVWDEYHIDQTINDRGIEIDMNLVTNAMKLDEKSKVFITDKLYQITKLDNPNSVSQMKTWLKNQGLETDTLGKKAVTSLIPETEGNIRDVLELRLQIAKSSIKKYQAMADTVCSDNRAHGMFQFYGANRSGRWAGRHIQIQNLPQNHLEDLDGARELVKCGNYDTFSMFYDDIPDTLSQLIRTAFIPRKGYKFIVSDFSAIEARVLAFLAKEQWRIDLFANGGDIYCQSASEMFKVPVEKHGQNAHLRQKGKIAELACIAEGSLVLTDIGLVPIENITTDMKLWDGKSWVQHDGVIYKGINNVITYEGVTATEDHLVYIEGQTKPVQLRIAASCGSHLLQTGDGRNPIRLGQNHITRKKMEQTDESLLCTDKMFRMQCNSMANVRQPSKRYFKRLSELLTSKADSKMAKSETDSSKTKMRESEQCSIQKLWCKRNKIRVSKCNGCRIISDKQIRHTRPEFRTGQNRYKWKLLSGKSSFYNKGGKRQQSEKNCFNKIRATILAILLHSCNKEVICRNVTGGNNTQCRNSSYRETEKLAPDKRQARLYDILNAGEHHRFTVSGKLVHNCGYGGATGALKAMGALSMGLKEEELQPLVDSWRDANKNIVSFWWDVDLAVKNCIRNHCIEETHNLTFEYQGSMMYIHLPSGRMLSYVKPKIEISEDGKEVVTYEGIGSTKKWERISSYGPKFVENITQAISRDVLAFAMKNLKDLRIVAHVHDELIIEMPIDAKVEDICLAMGATPPWIEGLYLKADGYETMFYKKD